VCSVDRKTREDIIYLATDAMGLLHHITVLRITS